MLLGRAAVVNWWMPILLYSVTQSLLSKSARRRTLLTRISASAFATNPQSTSSTSPPSLFASCFKTVASSSPVFSRSCLYTMTSITSTITTTAMTGYLNATDAAALDVELMSSEIGGYTLEQLMELAGQAVAEAVVQVLPAPGKNKEDQKKKKVLVLCGPGNNGGDGLVAARHLQFFGGYDCTIVYPKRSGKQPHYAHLVKQCENIGIKVEDEVPGSMRDYDAIIDALFGFSFQGLPREPFGTMLQQVMQAQAQSTQENSSPPVMVISVDIPSGWNVDEGDVNNSGFVPDVLVSLTTPKLCVQQFTTGRHFVGGRFLPTKIAAQYKVQMPPYPGVSQVMEVPVEAPKGEVAKINTDNNDVNQASSESWREEYFAYLAEKYQADKLSSVAITKGSG